MCEKPYECTCFIKAPCSYCIEHAECVGCGEICSNTDIDEETNLCTECYNRALEEGKIC